jgi:DDE superfamily endonuclease
MSRYADLTFKRTLIVIGTTERTISLTDGRWYQYTTRFSCAVAPRPAWKTFKKTKLHPLTDEQKLLNQEFARTRIIVENILAQFKNFKALVERFRHAVDRWDDVFRAVLAIVNPRTLKRLAAAQAA